MTNSKPIRRIAIIGTGVIGASWTALFLAKGLDVIATDIAPDAEAVVETLREGGVAGARAIGPRARRIAITSHVHGRSAGGRSSRGLRPGKRARADRLQEEAVSAARRAAAGRRDHRVELVGAHHERDSIGLPPAPGALRHRPSVQSAAPGPAGRDRRRHEDLGSDHSSAPSEFYTGLGKQTVRLRKEVPGHVANRLQAALAREVYYLVAEDVVSVADVDTALCWGPGLRWGIMGNVLLNHLGGGQGGIEHFFEQFTGPMTAWWKVLGQPELTPEVQKKLIDGLHAEVGSRSIADLEAQRDEVLLGLLELRAKVRRRLRRPKRLPAPAKAEVGFPTSATRNASCTR